MARILQNQVQLRRKKTTFPFSHFNKYIFHLTSPLLTIIHTHTFAVFLLRYKPNINFIKKQNPVI